MTVDLSPYYELDIDRDIIDFASEVYCANCTHVEFREDTAMQESVGTPYCLFWKEETEVELGMICEEYLPQGYE